MQKFSKTLITLLFLILNTTAVTAADKPSPHPQQTDNVEPSKIVAKVNGQPIYSDRLNADVKKQLGKYKKYGMKNQSADLMNSLLSKALDKEIQNELIRQESKKLKIDDIDKKAEDKFLAFRNRFPTEELFNRNLKMRGLTVEEAKANLKDSVYIDEYLLKQKITDPEIPEKALREFYESSPKDYHRKASINVSHILISVADNATQEEAQQAYLKATKIREEILAGKDFAKMAIQNSDCNSASGGGSLRYIERGYMPKEFDDAAFALDIDKISEVVKTKFGYHIIKVSEKIPEGQIPFEEARDFIKKYFQMDETKKRMNEHIAKLKEKAEIEIILPKN